MPVAPTPFYLDWTFWSFVVAGLAIVLSQVPPVMSIVSRRRLTVHVHGSVHVTHMVGYPNLQLYVDVRNVGRKPVRISRINLELSVVGGTSFTIPSQQYFVALGDQSPVLFVPKTLASGEEWGHVVKFWTELNQQDDRNVRTLRRAVLSDLTAKLEARQRTAPAETGDLEAAPEIVAPLMAAFNQNFRWQVGEYNLTLEIESDAETSSQCFRFTIFEQESAELRGYASDYKFGHGVAFDSAKHPGIIVPLFVKD